MVSKAGYMFKEIFDVVDEQDNIIGEASRKECHKKGLIHRSVMFFIFDKEKNVFVSKRTHNKDFFPGYWSVVLGGHVNSSESYDDAVIREIAEETGLKQKPFFMAFFKKRIPEERENVKVYGVVASGEILLSQDEIERGEFLSIKEIENRMGSDPFLPETEKLFMILKGYLFSKI